MIRDLLPRTYRGVNGLRAKCDDLGLGKPSVVVIKRRGSHLQYLKRGNVIYLPTPYIREHYLELENARRGEVD